MARISKPNRLAPAPTPSYDDADEQNGATVGGLVGAFAVSLAGAVWDLRPRRGGKR